ncbi:hypothetical protein MCOR25_007035 [Pyricularia grisea]|uniref:AB hydrolase-1 domain-containing protein n=1 Tax=Pyricularia grisea TaxID=148305 RepID=A0A6P8B0K7_PYRGI|nr:uncharacterized protein PgNI_07869 [Pyricularia grisea]KAI6359529.1 hypothetical protein MCOR25_007035 [Pyricularia grisea]TLD08445.1 hypothetical protein PgNI_07869 [Pyricularia grisea]
MLPSPTLSLTLPSLHDGTILAVRVYHPWPLSPSPKAPPWRRHAAVVAHPYAPMGGSYDDAIVGLVAETLLRAGFLVATFNFRGAHGSAGRTSWTAKAERADYMSVAGFVCHYAHFLDPFHHSAINSRPITPIPDTEDERQITPPSTRHGLSPSSPPPPTRSTTDINPTNNLPPPTSPLPPLLLFAGYSYGAMITTQIPSLPTILQHFTSPEAGSNAAEIRLRARSLADSQNTILGAARRAAERERRGLGDSPRKSLGLRIGGDEDVTGRRKSHDRSPLRASFDDAEEKLRRGVADFLAKTSRHHHHHSLSGQVGVPQRAVSTGGGRRSLSDRRSVSLPYAGRPPSGQGDALVLEGDQEDKPGEGQIRADGAEVKKLPILESPPNPRTAYLMVSPPLSIAGNLTALSFSLPGLTRRAKSTRRSSSQLPTTVMTDGELDAGGLAGNSTQKPVTAKAVRAASTMVPPPSELEEADQKLVESPSLVVYGDSDVFVSNRRMREWAARLQGVPGSKFRAHEVSSAGHFWQETPESGGGEPVARVLMHAVGTFAEGLLKDAAAPG